ncbi:MAG TPA: GrpB family protein [Solirubrobacterales bacterium]|nr:GrpB family protein [Solirubrobacterales bacterium]
MAEFELIGGVEKRAIEIVAYDPAWPRRFELERGKVEAALGAAAVRVEHIGSTAVPGLGAKPIVDIQLSVEDPAEESYIPPLEAAGYCLRVREEGHRMLRTADLDVHLHVCAADSDWERRHLLFRDWLRRSAADRRLYEETKRRLADRDWADMNAYADAKDEVVARIMRRAEAWTAEPKLRK